MKKFRKVVKYINEGENMFLFIWLAITTFIFFFMFAPITIIYFWIKYLRNELKEHRIIYYEEIKAKTSEKVEE
jgi:hypothetical protein